MSTKQTEALKLAQIAMRGVWAVGLTGGNAHSFEAAMKCIEDALAEQPAQQQEPVAWLYPDNLGRKVVWLGAKKPIIPRPDAAEPLYTSPPASKPWVGLTDEDDIIGMARDAFAVRYCALPVPESRIKALAEALDAKLRDKNAAPCKPLTDEPVIRWKCKGCGHEYMEASIDCDCVTNKGYERIEYFTAPQPSKPLTDEEIWDEVKAADLDWQTGWSLDEGASNRYITFARAIEAAHGIKGDGNV